ncbi:MAG: hypothetical protein NT115_06460 [Proteobacteria bacterium]|nr:hypothetical protein [Pseudomonadota bacterium]
MMIKQALFLLGTLSLCASVHAAGNAAEGQKKRRPAQGLPLQGARRL